MTTQRKRTPTTATKKPTKPTPAPEPEVEEVEVEEPEDEEPYDPKSVLADAVLGDEDGDEDAEDPSEMEWKVPLRVVPADDMPVTIGEKRDAKGRVLEEGDTYYTHEGEWVAFVPVLGVDTMFSTAGLILGSSGKGPRAAAKMLLHMETLCERLANVLADWTLTDLAGNPRPKPYKNPAAIKELCEDEVAWLIRHATGQEEETEEDRGNA